MRIGVLAAQGAFIEHVTVLRQLNADAFFVRLPKDLAGIDGLVIPGGESTTISRLMLAYDLASEVKTLVKSGLPVFGTCAGMIMLAKTIVDGNGVEPLRVMDITVRRNAFGRQKESFETELSIPAIGEKPFHAVFIRAPLIESVGNGVEVLSRLEDDTIVAARQGKVLVSSFHPELTNDPRFHQYFLDLAAAN
jgi:5'-phosphate synthase pdxT subunit